jgi:hypothetical protein
MQDAIDPQLGTPKAILHVLARRELAQIQSAPTMQIPSAEQTSDSI